MLRLVVVVGHTQLERLGRDVRRRQGVARSGAQGRLAAGGIIRIVAFAARCQELGIAVALQTCGAFGWESLAPHLELFELIHFDLKVMDSKVHRRLTGAGNRTILDNARRLVAAGAPVRFRMPVIPEHTDDEPNLRRIAGV